MKILLVNKYFYIKGGAENSFFETARLLKSHEHEIVFFSMKHSNNYESHYSEFFVSNVDYLRKTSLDVFKNSAKLLYSFEARDNIEKLISRTKPEIAHINNIYHQISPSILHSFRKYHIPVVMTLRDCKMVCPVYSLFFDGKICEKCRNGKYYECLVRKCVKGSFLKSILGTFEMYLHHKILKIYNLVDIFISPSYFLKVKLHELGFKKEIVVLPNFVDINNFVPQFSWSENSIVYFGRLAEGKGLLNLIKSVKGLPLRLKIVGIGPLKESLELYVKSQCIENVDFLGYLKDGKLNQEVCKSMFVVLPSESYEVFGRTILEGFALGKPAIASRIGGATELVKDGETGLTFESSNSNDLRSKILQLSENPDKIISMGKKARKYIEVELNGSKHYERLLEIYRRAIKMTN
ncbi:MAG: glycosyltransferase [Candidatus Omnitrophota bacterium]